MSPAPGPSLLQSYSSRGGGRSLPWPGRTSRTGLAARSIIDRPPKVPWRYRKEQEVGAVACREGEWALGREHGQTCKSQLAEIHVGTGTGLFCHPG